MNKKLYQVVKEEQVIAVLLATSEDECKEYLVDNNLVDNIDQATILEVAKQENEKEESVVPLMIAKRFSWYDLRHYRNLYIYKG